MGCWARVLPCHAAPGPHPRPAAAAAARAETDATLRVLGHQRVFALGDVAMAGASAPLPITAQVAIQQSDYVAWNLWAAINSKPLLSFRWVGGAGGGGGFVCVLGWGAALASSE